MSGTPTAAGNYSGIVISASNSAGTASLPSFAIAVTLPAPTISGTPVKTAAVGSVYSFTPTATNAASFSVTGPVPPGISFDGTTGTLSGTLTTAGSYGSIVISATNATGTAALAGVTISVTLPKPTISGTPAATGNVGSAYSFAPVATNAASFSGSGALPPGLSLNTANGVLTGTPTTIGSYSNIVITASNATGTTSLAAFTITIGAQLPTISGTPAASAHVGSPYSFTPVATLATSFGVAGSLPPGIVFTAATGTLSGTPTTVGSYSNIVISASNGAGTVSLPPFTITVAAPLPTIAGTPATTAAVGTAYSFTPTASNALSYSVSGALPPGLSFNGATGTLSGTPSAVGVYGNIVISAGNAGGTASLPPFTITVGVALPTISGTPATTASVGVNYAFAPTATGAASFSVTGVLPPGLSLDAATGVLSGVPTTVGSFSNIVIVATNASGSASLPAFGITVADVDGPLSVTAPAAEFSTAKDSFTLSGSVTAAVLPNTLSVSIDGVPLPSASQPVVAGDGSFSVIVPLAARGTTYAVVVTATDQAGKTFSVQRAVTRVYPSGNLADGVSKPSIADALKALQFALRLATPSADELANADLAPLVNGKPAPNGRIDAGDALVILEKIVGTVAW